MTDQRSNTQLSERRLGAPRRGDNRENGFSLVELMVVVMILGVLLAVALPTFLGARRPASDRRAETILHTALLAARSSVDTQEGYANLSTAKLLGAEGSIRFIDGGITAAMTSLWQLLDLPLVLASQFLTELMRLQDSGQMRHLIAGQMQLI